MLQYVVCNVPNEGHPELEAPGQARLGREFSFSTSSYDHYSKEGAVERANLRNPLSSDSLVFRYVQ